jgi:predicted pyridoxine 5'-phosphate oxidase superfamily flavin-nucleotide-binding protein
MAKREISPFHTGELAVQAQSGVLEDAAMLGGMFRPYLTEQHRQFFAQLPLLFVGSMDDAGQPWASMLFGAPGFVHAPDPRTLSVEALPAQGDPLAAALHEGANLGVLGIQLQNRRRNRLNGRVREVSGAGFTLDVDQSFGNCPRYISARMPQRRAGVPPGASPLAETAQLSDAAAALLASADTCFIASASARAPAADDTREGVDVSHRGGKPGFLRVERSTGATQLLMPDFPGNNAFNTLGNLARYPRAGLLVPDFASGDALSLACSAEILWDGPELARFQGAERMVVLTVHSGLYFPRSMPFQWSQPLPGPHVERTGSW